MDVVSHAALSAAAAAALARPGALRTAAATGALAGLLPDADVLIGSSSDPLLNLEFHRHFTHSVAFLPLGAAIAALVAWLLLRRRSRFLPLYGHAVAGYAAALLLDACTSYGTHLFWPFSQDPVAWGVISVIDPAFTVPVVAALVFGLVKRRRTAARLALCLGAAVIALGALQHERAKRHAAELAQARGHPVERLLVKPTLGNLLLWRSLYVTEGRIHVDAVRVGLGSVRIYPGASAPRFDPAESALPPGSRARRDLERFVAFAAGLPVRHPRRPELIGDARYALLPDSIAPLWGVVIDPDAPERPARFETLRATTPQLRRRFLDMLLGREVPPAEPAGLMRPADRRSPEAAAAY